MLFVVRFTDRPGGLPIRKRFMPAHLEWLDTHRAVILVAGSVRTDSDATPSGAIWIVEANTGEDVQDLLRRDPFWIEGLRESVEILHWSKAFPDRQISL